MDKKQIAEWLKKRVLEKRSPSGTFLEYYLLTPEDFKKLLEMLEETKPLIF